MRLWSKVPHVLPTSFRRFRETPFLSLMRDGNRKLKVYGKYQARACRGKMLPEIRLCGIWLKDAGFTVGSAVLVTYEANKIVINIIGCQPKNADMPATAETRTSQEGF